MLAAGVRWRPAKDSPDHRIGNEGKVSLIVKYHQMPAAARAVIDAFGSRRLTRTKHHISISRECITHVRQEGSCSALVAVTMLSVPVAPVRACHWFDRMCGKQTTYYAPVAAAPCCAAPVQQTVSYMPTTAYRSVIVNRPVVSYSPQMACDACGRQTTVMRPVTTFVAQQQLVPYTTFRPVVTAMPVAQAPCCGSTPVVAAMPVAQPMMVASPIPVAAPAPCCGSAPVASARSRPPTWLRPRWLPRLRPRRPAARGNRALRCRRCRAIPAALPAWAPRPMSDRPPQ